MERIYLDNASQAYPKADGVIEILNNYSDDSHNLDEKRQSSVKSINNSFMRMFNCGDEFSVYVTDGIYSAASVVFDAMLNSSSHCICAFDEDNRIIDAAKSAGIELTVLPLNEEGCIDLSIFESSIQSNTALAIIPHASSDFGVLQDIESISQLCKSHNIKLAVDVSQTAGVCSIDLAAAGADALILSSEKSLLSLEGAGAAVIRTSSVCTFGVNSEGLSNKVQSTSLFALEKSLKFIENVGISEIYEKTEQLIVCFLYDLKHMKNVTLRGTWNSARHAGIIAVSFDGESNAECVRRLADEFNIQAFYNSKNDSVRFSVSYFNTFEEVNEALNAIAVIAAGEEGSQ